MRLYSGSGGYAKQPVNNRARIVIKRCHFPSWQIYIWPHPVSESQGIHLLRWLIANFKEPINLRSILFLGHVMSKTTILLLMVWQSPGLPEWRKVNFITVTRRPHHPNIAAGLYCLATSPGFLPTLCEKWSGFFYVHRVFLSYTRDRRLKVSSERHIFL